MFVVLKTRILLDHWYCDHVCVLIPNMMMFVVNVSASIFSILQFCLSLASFFFFRFSLPFSTFFLSWILPLRLSSFFPSFFVPFYCSCACGATNDPSSKFHLAHVAHAVSIYFYWWQFAAATLLRPGSLFVARQWWGQLLDATLLYPYPTSVASTVDGTNTLHHLGRSKFEVRGPGCGRNFTSWAPK